MTHLKGYFEMSNYDNCNKPSISVSQNKHMLGPRSIGLNHTERSNTKKSINSVVKVLFLFFKNTQQFSYKITWTSKEIWIGFISICGNPPPHPPINHVKLFKNFTLVCVITFNSLLMLKKQNNTISLTYSINTCKWTSFSCFFYVLFSDLLSLVKVSWMAGYFSLNFSLISFFRVEGFT